MKADGRTAEIRAVAMATAEGITEIAKSIYSEGGTGAVNLRITEQYISEFGNLAKANNTMIIPSNLSEVAGVIPTAKAFIGIVNPKSAEE